MSRTLDYGKLYKRIEKGVGQVDGEGGDVRVLGRRVAGMGFEGLDELGAAAAAVDGEEDRVEVWTRFPNGVLLADEGVGYWCLMGGGGASAGKRVLEEEIRVDGIGCACVIGVNEHERLERQRVVVGICFRRGTAEEDEERWGRKVVGCYQEVTRVVSEVSYIVLRRLCYGFVFTSMATSPVLCIGAWPAVGLSSFLSKVLPANGSSLLLFLESQRYILPDG